MVFWQTKDNIGIGSKAPDFTLPSQSGEMVNLTDLLDGKPVGIQFSDHKTSQTTISYYALKKQR